MTNLIIFFLAVILAIVIGSKTKTNMGLWAICFALLIGYLVINKSPARLLAGAFPVSIFYNVFCVTMFFGFANSNGAIILFAQKLRYAMRNAPNWAGTLTIFLISIVISLCGGGTGVVSPIVYPIAVALGLHPFIAAAGTSLVQSMVRLFPFLSTGATNVGIAEKYVSQEQAMAAGYFTGISAFVFFGLEFLVIAIIFGRRNKAESVGIQYEKPADFNPVQKKTLIVMLVVFILLLVPSLIQVIAPNKVTKLLTNVLSMQFLWTFGSILLAILGCADLKEVISKRVSWNTILMVCGMSILFGIASDLGVADTLSNFVQTVPKWMVVPALAAVCGVLSFFVSGSVINPMFMGLASMFMETTGVSFNVIYTAIALGSMFSSISPISQGGAGTLIGIAEKDHPVCMKWMAITAIVSVPLGFFYILVLSKLF